MKYIVIDTPVGEMGFTFNNFVVHKSVAEHMQHLLIMDHKFNPSEVKVISGGFVDSDGNCFGKSESLNLESRENDSFIIRR